MPTASTSSGWAGARRGAVVLGHPIAHSLSPALHRAAYAQLGLTGWTYDAVDCDEAQLPATLRRLEAAGLAGASLTMPLKRAVLPLLTRTERLAEDVGAVNTVLFGGIDGEWWGGNTDVPALAGIVRDAAVPVDRRAALVLGAGATAASTIAALAELGARDVTVAARRLDAVDELAGIAARFGVEVTARPLEAVAEAVGEAVLVVSTLPAGAADGIADQLRPGGTSGLLVDVVYAGWPTALARSWAALGGTVVGGLELLVRQAALQVRLMTGRDPDLDVMRSAGEAALASTRR